MSWAAVAVVGSSVVGAYTSGEAADSAETASRDASVRSVEEQRRQYDQTRADQDPYRQAGYNALRRLQGQPQSQYGDIYSVLNGRIQPGGQFLGGQNQPLLQGGTQQGPGIDDQGQPLPEYQSTPMYNAFQGGPAPDAYNAAPAFSFDQFQLENSPGYQFKLNQGTEAVNRGAARSGNLNSGARLLALQEFGQGLASDEYGKEYSRQFGASQDAFNRNVSGYGLNYQRNQDMYNRGASEYGLGAQRNQDQYNRNLTGYQAGYQRNQDTYGRGQNVLNRYAALAGLGQTSLSQTSAAGMNAADQNSAAYQQNALMQTNAANTRYGGLNNAIQGGIQNYMVGNYLNQGQNNGISPELAAQREEYWKY